MRNLRHLRAMVYWRHNNVKTCNQKKKNEKKTQRFCILVSIFDCTLSCCCKSWNTRMARSWQHGNMKNSKMLAKKKHQITSFKKQKYVFGGRRIFDCTFGRCCQIWNTLALMASAHLDSSSVHTVGLCLHRFVNFGPLQYESSSFVSPNIAASQNLSSPDLWQQNDVNKKKHVCKDRQMTIDTFVIGRKYCWLNGEMLLENEIISCTKKKTFLVLGVFLNTVFQIIQNMEYRIWIIQIHIFEYVKFGIP